MGNRPNLNRTKQALPSFHCPFWFAVILVWAHLSLADLDRAFWKRNCYSYPTTNFYFLGIEVESKKLGFFCARLQSTVSKPLGSRGVSRVITYNEVPHVYYVQPIRMQHSTESETKWLKYPLLLLWRNCEWCVYVSSPHRTIAFSFTVKMTGMGMALNLDQVVFVVMPLCLREFWFFSQLF